MEKRMRPDIQDTFCVVLVTTGARAEAEAIASTLVQEHLAACVNFTPVNSVYTWQEKVCQEEEWQLIIKTRTAVIRRLQQRLQEIHSYDVPEFVVIPMLTGSSAYLQWIGEQTID
jgi:periplasmic divalent cation tolerance protein